MKKFKTTCNCDFKENCKIIVMVFMIFLKSQLGFMIIMIKKYFFYGYYDKYHNKYFFMVILIHNILKIILKSQYY